MRLEQNQIEKIKLAAHNTFGNKAHIWLFGSRVDDAKKGGDIDLYIEIPETAQPARQKIQFKMKLERELDNQKIDVVLHQITKQPLPIHDWAKTTGIQLF